MRTIFGYFVEIIEILSDLLAFQKHDWMRKLSDSKNGSLYLLLLSNEERIKIAYFPTRTHEYLRKQQLKKQLLHTNFGNKLGLLDCR